MEARNIAELSPEQEREAEAAKKERSFKSGANWFFWIAGLSLVNSLVQFFEGAWGFVVGLGITQVIDAVAATLAAEASAQGALFARGVALALDVVVAGIFVLFGWLARSRRPWAFILGMVIYTMDGLLFLLVKDWLGLGFHAFVLFALFTGFTALKRWRELQTQLMTGAVEPIG